MQNTYEKEVEGFITVILVSSCLAGLACRYDGSHKLIDRISELVEQNKAVMVCPELLGGFSTPREPAEIKGGTGEDVLEGKAKVYTRSGEDVTELYVKGAYETLKLAKEIRASAVILKESSPSCGTRMIYDGTFNNRKVNGEGITSSLLRKEGFRVLSEEEWLENL